MPEGLDTASCTYHSPHGKVVSNWEKNKDGYLYEVSVPKESTARVILPMPPAPNIQIKIKKDNLDEGQIEDMQTGKFTLGGGHYMITVSYKNG
jgi:alpha-L-rhamnosidase